MKILNTRHTYVSTLPGYSFICSNVALKIFFFFRVVPPSIQFSYLNGESPSLIIINPPKLLLFFLLLNILSTVFNRRGIFYDLLSRFPKRSSNVISQETSYSL